MSGIFWYAILFLSAYLLLLVSGSEEVSQRFYEYRVVPDFIPVPPNELLAVVYPGDVRVYLGNELSPTQTLTSPSVCWDADPNSLYTLAMAGEPNAPVAGELVHWLVINIKGNDVAGGKTVASYLQPTPLPGFGFFRYVFLIYEQSCDTKYNTSLLDFTSANLRVNFSISDFAKKYDLGDPVFGNFCRIESLPIKVL